MQRDVASVWKAKAFHIEGRGDFTMAEDEQGLEELQCVPKGAAGTAWFPWKAKSA